MARISIAEGAKVLLQQLNQAGFAAYAVGGCVRDSLLGQTPKDWDICTSALPEQIMEVFSALHCIPTGLAYGTITVRYEGESYEVTTFRKELGYSDSRHPDGVRFLSSLREDLARRDFTINAMAADSHGQVTDCFGGRADLEQGLIRCVGEARERFAEDALRMLRALRFAARLGFSIEETTAAAIHERKESLLRVAPERLRKEISGLLCGKAAAELLDRFSDVIFLLIPELRDSKDFCQFNYHHALDVWQHSLLTLTSIPATEPLRLAALLHDVGKPSCFHFDKYLVGHFYGHAKLSCAYAQRILRRLRYDNDTIDRVCTLIRCHDTPLMPRPKEGGSKEKTLRRLLGKLGQEQLLQLIELKRADRLGKGNVAPAEVDQQIAEIREILQDILQKELCVRQDQLALSGRDLMELGMPPGPEMGRLLRQMLEGVIEGNLPNERAVLVEFAQKQLVELRKH